MQFESIKATKQSVQYEVSMSLDNACHPCNKKQQLRGIKKKKKTTTTTWQVIRRNIYIFTTETPQL